jgi:hypothetical protein
MIIGKISRPALYICCATALWGVVSALTAAIHNYIGLMFCRVALGITEAVFVGDPARTKYSWIALNL